MVGGRGSRAHPSILPLPFGAQVCTSAVEDEDQRPYLRSADFLLVGSIMTALAWAGIATIYYGVAYAADV